jgi:hypothetical protein
MGSHPRIECYIRFLARALTGLGCPSETVPFQFLSFGTAFLFDAMPSDNLCIAEVLQ